MDKWCVPLLRACEDYISSLIKERREGVGLGSNDMEVEMITYLFTLGEVAQVGWDILLGSIFLHVTIMRLREQRNISFCLQNLYKLIMDK